MRHFSSFLVNTQLVEHRDHAGNSTENCIVITAWSSWYRRACDYVLEYVIIIRLRIIYLATESQIK